MKFLQIRKLQFLKVVRTFNRIRIKRSKRISRISTKTIQEGLAKDAAEDAKKQIEEAGGKASLT
jgi:large subunit ribosomal protein L7/L12